jgi:hypothetical protein
MVVRVVGFDLRCDPAQPSPARVPPAPHTPPCAPLLLSLSHLDFPRSNLSLPLPSLSPRGALGLGDDDHQNLDPEVSSPPFPSPLSLPLPPLSPCARPLFSPLRARVPARRRGTPPRPSPSPSGAAPPLPSPAVLGPPLLPGPPARPCAGAARRGRVPARAQPLRGRGSARAQPMRGARPRPPATRLRPLRAAVLAPLRGVRPSD